MINFLNLEYFLVAAEELNFTRAAKKLFISQQSLSNHISNLEKEFDVVLFNRTSPLTLTYAGPVSYTHLDVYKRQALCSALTIWNGAPGNWRRTMIKWKFLNCICIFAAAIFILWVGCNEQPVDTEKADGSDSIASIEAPSNSQATLEEPTTESIVTESSVVESEYYPITEGQRYLGVYVQGPEETDVLADSINTCLLYTSIRKSICENIKYRTLHRKFGKRQSGDA